MFNIILHEPEIPNNTGNIGRTCVATGCSLHLVHPLGFSTSVKACRRAGLDYWPRLAPKEHADFDACLAQVAPPRLWLFTTHARTPLWSAQFHPGDALVFGKETRGLPDSLLQRFPDRLLLLPMAPDERSLNLATAVCAVVYEGLRQLVQRHDLRLRLDGRLDLPPSAPAPVAPVPVSSGPVSPVPPAPVLAPSPSAGPGA